MKLWQLNWLLNDQKLLCELLGKEPQWGKFVPALEEYNRPAKPENRDLWDEMVDPELCHAALEAWARQFWIDENGYLVEYRPEQDRGVQTSRLISAHDAYRRYGADVLVEVIDKGRVKVQSRVW